MLLSAVMPWMRCIYEHASQDGTPWRHGGLRNQSGPCLSVHPGGR
ncbi:hypothetical protein I7I48_11984 [Histoplasma ohiense]|nr:hypothetical protein I7I48_11984 [Histoplasma ohiense (nom. inval.)]